MRVVFAGTPQVAVPSLRALLRDHDVVAVLTRADAPAGRGRGTRPSPVRVAAEEAGVPVLTPASLREPGVVGELEELAPDVVVVVAYGLLVPPTLLDLPRHGWVNLHFSLLPAWRGAAPVQHALLAGDDVTGAVTFRLEQGLDTGPVLAQLTETIRPDDTSGTLLERLADAGAGLVAATLEGLADGSLTAVPQPGEGISHAPKIEVDDAQIVWNRPAYAVDRHIRAMTPAPGAWTTWRGERAKLGPVGSPTPHELTLLGEAHADGLAPGQLHVQRRAVLAGTADGPVRLGEVQAKGKRAMPATDWARGARPEEGESFDG